MRVENIICPQGSVAAMTGAMLADADLVFYFISPDYGLKKEYFETLRRVYPSAQIIGCTTGGEIAGDEALAETAVSSAVRLKHTKIRVAQTHIDSVDQSYNAGKYLAEQLNSPDLRLIFVLSEGLKMNGNELIRGITEHAHKELILTGGLAGDGKNFKETGVGVNALPLTGNVAAIGFYGDKLQVSYGTAGGWAKFGPTRVITRSKGNVLYELDGKNALELYKKYLGDEAKNLPGSGQFFPLSISPTSDSEHEVVRAFLAIDEKEQSLLFAGDVPQGYTARLMRGNTDNLVDGAATAASFACENMEGISSDHALALLVSCVGRNMMMKQHVSSEIEAVKQVLGDIPLAGFYSYGEICHHSQTKKCDFHNQTMTITVIAEPE